MGKGKRDTVCFRGGDVFDWHGARRSDDQWWDAGDSEDDPRRVLRPLDEDMQNPAGDEYVWPDIRDENEEDD